MVYSLRFFGHLDCNVSIENLILGIRRYIRMDVQFSMPLNYDKLLVMRHCTKHVIHL